MKKLNLTQILELKRNLPEEVRRVLASESVSDAVMSIAKKHDLRVDQSGKFANSVNMVLLGALHPSKLVEYIEKDVVLPHKMAVALAQDANELILKPVREEILGLHDNRAEPSENKPLSKESNLPTETSEVHKVFSGNNSDPTKTEEKKPAYSEDFEVAREKLEKPVRTPPEDVVLSDTKNKPVVTDPYREPVE